MLWILNSNCEMRYGKIDGSPIGNQFKNSMFEQLELTNAEINKLKMNTVPNTVALTLIDLNKDIFPT